MNPDWPTLHILLPVGISFYTFQAISYTIDVYRGEVKQKEAKWARASWRPLPSIQWM